MLRSLRSDRSLYWVSLQLCMLLASPRSEAQASPAGTTPRAGFAMGRTRLFVVDDTPSPCRFSDQIQAAVNAASDGDVVLVKGGAYSGVIASFVIDGKALCVIGEDSPTANFHVKNLPAGKSVVVRGFRWNAYNGAVFTNNSGPLWVEDCSHSRSSSLSTVGMFRCQILGNGSATLGAFHAESSTVFAYHSSFQGLAGNDAYYEEGFCEMSGGLECYWSESSEGQLGLSLAQGSSAFLAGCSLAGGRGGSAAFPFCGCFFWPGFLLGSCGGNALRLSDSTVATVLQTDIVSGLPDCDHAAVTGSGTLVTLPGQTGEFSVDSPVAARAPLHYRFRGPPGWRAFVTYASEYTPVFDPVFHGMSVVPLDSPTVFVGTLPASGVLETDVPAGNLLDPGAEARVFYMQAKFYDLTTGRGVLGTPSALVIVQDPCL